MGMRVESLEGALIIHAGIGEWYNQQAWGMLEDTGLPPAQWHAEVDHAIGSCQSKPSVVVIDATDMVWLTFEDYAFFIALSDRLRPAGVKVTVLARPNEIRAFECLPLKEHLKVVATLEEALREQ